MEGRKDRWKEGRKDRWKEGRIDGGKERKGRKGLMEDRKEGWKD